MECLGLEHPALRAVALTTMMAHLQIAADLTRPGGTFVLTVDTVARPPEMLAELAERMSMADLLFSLESTRQCLPGTEASIVANAIERVFPAATVELAPPWLWTVTEERTSVVYGIVTHKPS
jgi:hypothetical protein